MLSRRLWLDASYKIGCTAAHRHSRIAYRPYIWYDVRMLFPPPDTYPCTSHGQLCETHMRMIVRSSRTRAFRNYWVYAQDSRGQPSYPCAYICQSSPNQVPTATHLSSPNQTRSTATAHCPASSIKGPGVVATLDGGQRHFACLLKSGPSASNCTGR